MRISDWSSDVCSSDLQDLVDLRAGECADLGLFLARPRRAHGEDADADDPVLLAERVQNLGGLLGQADDALRAAKPGLGIRDSGFGKTAIQLFRIPNPTSRLPALHGYSIRFDHAPA